MIACKQSYVWSLIILIIEIPSFLPGDWRCQYFCLFGRARPGVRGQGCSDDSHTLTLSLPSHCSLLTSHLSLEETAEAPTDGSRLTDGGCRLGAATVLLGHSQCWPRAPLLPSPTRVSIHLWYTIRSSPCNWWQSFSPQEMWEELDWPRAKVSLLEIEPGVILLGLGPLTALTKWSSYK